MNIRISVIEISIIQKLQEHMLGIKEMVRKHSSYFIILNYQKIFEEKNATLRNNLSYPISRPKKVNLDLTLNY